MTFLFSSKILSFNGLSVNAVGGAVRQLSHFVFRVCRLNLRVSLRKTAGLEKATR